MTKKKLLFSTILLLILLNLSSSINLPPFPSVADLPYQAHSFNDVTYIRQLLRRGVKYFKIDVSLANRDSCIKNSDWNQTQKCYRTTQYAEQYCCLALRGDTSGRNHFDYAFSTLDNFIDMIEQHIAQRSIDKILFFAINFQFDFQFGNMLVENCMFRLAKLMQKYPSLYFGTGTDNFILEYDRICRTTPNQTNVQNEFKQPLLSLNEQACTVQRKTISKQRFFLQSGANDPSDPRDYYGRYRNFNVYYKAITDRCQNGFPSWVKKYPQFPLIFWQPSDQKQIQLIIENFLSDKCRRHHGRDINGLAITSNIDPQVFQFYLKKVNESINNPMTFYPNNDKISLKYSNNFLTRIATNNANYMIFGQQDSVTDKFKGSSLELAILSNDQTTQKVQQVARKQLPASKGTVKIIGGTLNLIVVQKPLQNVEDNTMNLILLNGTLQKIADTQLDRYVQISYNNGQYYILRQTVNPTVFNVIKTSDFSKTSIVLSFSLIFQRAKSIQSFLVVQDGDGTLRYFLSGSVNKNVWVGQIRNDNIYKSGLIGFGTNSKLTSKDNGMLLITIENGACNSGVQINNGDTPECLTYKYPEFKPMTSTKSTITMMQTTITNLMQYIQKQSNIPITPCTQKFIHSKVFNGRNINVVDIWNRLFFVSEYVHISQQGMLNALFCAPSNFDKLTNNKKGILGTIWSRGNLGQFQIKNSSQKISENNKDIELIEV